MRRLEGDVGRLVLAEDRCLPVPLHLARTLHHPSAPRDGGKCGGSYPGSRRVASREARALIGCLVQPPRTVHEHMPTTIRLSLHPMFTGTTPPLTTCSITAQSMEMDGDPAKASPASRANDRSRPPPVRASRHAARTVGCRPQSCPRRSAQHHRMDASLPHGGALYHVRAGRTRCRRGSSV